MFSNSISREGYFTSGFTLVELLIVVGIIAALSSVAMVNLRSARSKAKEAAVVSVLNSLNTAVLSCVNDNKQLTCTNDALPGGYCGNNANKPTPGVVVCSGSSNTWPDLAEQYTDWDYTEDFVSDITNYTYTIKAAMLDQSLAVVCTETGCLKTDEVSAEQAMASVPTCGNGILESGELCDSIFSGTCAMNSSYYTLGYVAVGACSVYSSGAGCNNTCNVCLLNSACIGGGKSMASSTF